MINLTAEDLIKAGYKNTKKPWTEEEDEKLTLKACGDEKVYSKLGHIVKFSPLENAYQVDDDPFRTVNGGQV